VSDPSPTPGLTRFSRMVRTLMDPRTPAAERQHVAQEMASLGSAELAALSQNVVVRRALAALDEPFLVGEPVPGGRNNPLPAAVRGYGLGADLRLLLHESWRPAWYTMKGDIAAATHLSDRALICAAAERSDVIPVDDPTLAVAWTQLLPGAGLLAVSEGDSGIDGTASAYLQHALVRGASQRSIPRSLAVAINREVASRPDWRHWLDLMTRWLEARVATASFPSILDKRESQTLARWLLFTRSGVAVRAVADEIRAPRLFALAELLTAVTLIRAAGRVDLLRAYGEAAGDAARTVALHRLQDHRAELLMEVAVGMCLSVPKPSELVGLTDQQRSALGWMTDVTAADSGLNHGLLIDVAAGSDDGPRESGAAGGAP
jgi:hypothetical protein